MMFEFEVELSVDSAVRALLQILLEQSNNTIQ